MIRTAFTLALALIPASPLAGQDHPFIRGDATGNGLPLEISDPVATLGYLFLGRPVSLPCLDAADSNDSGDLDIADALYALGFLFVGWQAPPAPYPDCGADPTPDALGCSSPCSLPPEASFSATPRTGEAPLTVRFDGSLSRDPEGKPLRFAWDFGDGARSQEAGPVHRYTAAGSYRVSLTVTDEVALSDTATLVVSVREPGVAPDPGGQAPPLDRTTVPEFLLQVQFLYSGDDPVQKGARPEVFERKRIAVLRGKVQARDGGTLKAVRVNVLGHPEYGETSTRDDGFFDLAVNGGGLIVLNYELAGYCQVQRKVQTPWLEYACLPDVVMTPIDPTVTTIALDGGEGIQVARGTEVRDEDGARCPVVLISPGTSAEMILPDGERRPLRSAALRVTEFTVGQSGPLAMPGELPPSSGYTYAAEFTFDEALVARANSVEFTRPVTVYLENFLGFPTGTQVPTGFYDRQKAAWIPHDDGRIVSILSIAEGRAQLDVDGSQTAAGPADLAALAITDDELFQLASLYATGRALWRARLTHFSPWDFNWPFGPPEDATPPNQSQAMADPKEDRPCEGQGSLIEFQNQILRESLPIVGTPYFLHYASDRVPGRTAAKTLDIPLSGPVLPPALQRIDLEVEILGRVFRERFAPPIPHLDYSLAWDGKDPYGRTAQGRIEARIRIGYVYPLVYRTPASLRRSFSAFGAGTLSNNPGRSPAVIWQEYRTAIGAWDGRGIGLGGWSLDAHHVYDPFSRVLYLGDGRRSTIEQALGDSISTVAGNGTAGIGGEGAAATDAQLNFPCGVSLSADGTIYIAQPDGFTVPVGHAIRAVLPDGTMRTVAGTGPPGYSGDGGPATAARLRNPHQVKVGVDGDLYIADAYNHVVRKVIDPLGAGIISTIAGTGPAGYRVSDEGAPATAALLNIPNSIAVASDGTIYISDNGNRRVRKVTPDGLIYTIAGTGQNGFTGDGGPASAARIEDPNGVAVGSDGAVFISTGHRVRRIGLDGIIATIAGTGVSGFTEFAFDASTARIASPNGLIVSPDGGVYFASVASHTIQVIGGDGSLRTLVGQNTAGFEGDGGLARRARLDYLQDVALGPDGGVYIADQKNHRIRRVGPSLPGFSTGEIAIPSDDGTVLYRFSSSGRHLETIHALTGATLLTFSYDAAGRLASITDSFDNITRIERDDAGSPVAVSSPFGQRSSLLTSDDGYLEAIALPGGEEVFAFEYADDGLLTRMVNPRGKAVTFGYDQRGRLTADSDPIARSEDRGQALARSETADGYQVSHSTPLERVSTYQVERPPQGAALGNKVRKNIFPDGTQNQSTSGATGRYDVSLPDGTAILLVEGPDPRFGMESPVPQQASVRTPQGRTLAAAVEVQATLQDPRNPLSLSALAATTRINGRPYRANFHADDRLIELVSPEGRRSLATINDQGQLLERESPGQVPIRYAYNARGRLAGIAQGEGATARTLSLAYDAAGFLETVTDSLGRTVAFAYDPVGRVTAHHLPSDPPSRISFSYDGNGNLVSLTPPGKPPHTFDYNDVDLPEREQAPPVGAEAFPTEYLYNIDRQITQTTLPGGEQVPFAFEDSSGRLSAVQLPGGTFTFAYDPVSGHVTGIDHPERGSVVFAYDGFLLRTETWTGEIAGSVERDYDNDFRVGSFLINATVRIVFAYDGDSLLTRAGLLAITRDPDTGFVTSTRLDNVRDVSTYNEFGELETYTASTAAGPIYAFSLVYDTVERIVRKTESVQGETIAYDYGYDALGRLAEVLEDGALLARYSYDANGNRTSVFRDGVEIQASHDEQDRLVAYGDGSFRYTRNGHLRSKTTPAGETIYDYEVLGNLLSVALPGGDTVAYIIDARNRRIGRKKNGEVTQRLLYQDDLRPIAELDARGGVSASFVYGTRSNVPEYLLRAGVTLRIVADHLGSPRLIVNSQTGQVLQRIDYDEFGRVILDTSPGFQPFGFAGGLYDPDTGLVRFGLRDYDAETGRWTARDPIGFAGGMTNLYAYVLNDPVNLHDPSGLYITPLDAVDYASFGLSLRDFVNCPGWSTAGWLTVDAIGVILPVIPSIGAIRHAGRGTTVIGRFNKATGNIDGIRAGENSLLKHLPNQGSPKANWAQNAGVLRQEMNKGLPIRDAAVNLRTGELVDYPGSFLNAERNLLRDRGWTYDPATTLWSPP